MVGFKNRYKALEVILDPSKQLAKKDPVIITTYHVTKAIKDSIMVNFGECGLASSLVSFQVKYVNEITRLCIIRASREDHKKIWAAITLVRSIADCPVIFNLLDLSGSIRACKTVALKCDESKFEQSKLVVGSNLSVQDNQKMQFYLDKIKGLEL